MTAFLEAGQVILTKAFRPCCKWLREIAGLLKFFLAHDWWTPAFYAWAPLAC